MFTSNGNHTLEFRVPWHCIILQNTQTCQSVIQQIYFIYIKMSGFGGLGVACWPLVPKFAGSNPAETVGFLSMLSFGGEVKPSVPCCRFAACKRSLNGVEVVISAKITGQLSRPQFPLPPLGSLTS